MSNIVLTDEMTTEERQRLHARVQAFVSAPDYPEKLRRTTAKHYHPDKLPPELRELGGEIMAGINGLCDKLQGKR